MVAQKNVRYKTQQELAAPAGCGTKMLLFWNRSFVKICIEHLNIVKK